MHENRSRSVSQALLSNEERQLFSENFRNEAKLLNELSPRHPSIVRVYDCGELQSPEAGRVPYLALAWLSSGWSKRTGARWRQTRSAATECYSAPARCVATTCGSRS
ncbi:MAG: hypothetical protein RL701_1598, partial [Pseudomonadota bacterium]